MHRALARAASSLAVVALAAGVVVAVAAGGGFFTPRVAAAHEDARRAWLGVALDKAPAGGVVARHVVNNSPAARAGVVDGDQILTADGVALAEPNQLIARVALIGPGSALPMRIRHGSVDRNVTAALVSFPGPEEVLRLDKVGTFAPGWKAASAVSGSLPVSVDRARGKVLLVDFWASWCGPCRMVAPQLSQWQSTYGAQGLAVIGFTDDPIPVATQSAQAMGMNYAVASDPSGATTSAYGVSALPTMFLIDKKGVIREVFVGFDPGHTREVEKAFVALLAEPAPVIRILDELLWALRREGFVVSTPQAIDALRAVTFVGFGDRAALRDAVAAVVVERRADRDRFREAFDAFFTPDRAHAGDLWSRLRARGFDAAELAALRELLDAAAERSGASGDAPALAGLLGAESELDHLLLAAGVARALAPLTSPLQTGFFAQRVMEQIGLPRAATALRRIALALREALGEERGQALAKALAEELDRARRRVRMHVERTLAERVAEPLPERGGRRAGSVPFAGLTEAEREEIRRSVRGLAERLRGAERVRRRRALRGRIDPHRTLRLSLRTGGVPFRPARRRRRRDRPRLVILCDVSDSVRAASLFMLELVHVAQELFAGTRSFVFVSELAETTRLFADHGPDAALGRIYGGGAVSLAHNSNYGRALAAFEERVAREIDRRTTVVILGDGRANYLADGADTVARLRERARQLLWICPEAPGSWGSGDSAMPRYAAAATRVLVARTAKELEIAAREVASRR